MFRFRFAVSRRDILTFEIALFMPDRYLFDFDSIQKGIIFVVPLLANI